MNTPHTVSSRFVILHHTHAGQQAGSVRAEHWDLMLERDGVLLTWQLLGEPKGAESLPMGARRIGDHRLAYLTYEGPISGDRGHVRRIDAGTVEFHEITPDRSAACKHTWLVTLNGSLLAGRFVLRGENREWVLSTYHQALPVASNRDDRA